MRHGLNIDALISCTMVISTVFLIFGRLKSENCVGYKDSKLFQSKCS